MMRIVPALLSLCAVPALASSLAAQSAAVRASAFELTVANIMRGPEHVGSAPSDVRWTDDARWIYFRWTPGGQAWDAPSALYRVPAAGGTPERIGEETPDSLGVLLASGPDSPDERWRVVSHDGDLHLIDRRTLALRRLTATRASESDPVFNREGSAIYYLSDNNIFELRLDGAAIRQVSDFRTGPAPAEPRPEEGQRGFLADQQRRLFEYIERQASERERNQQRARERRESDPLRIVYLERNERAAGIGIEPSGRYAVVTTARTGGPEARRVSIPYWVTESGYTEPRDVRSKVGDTQGSAGRIGLVSLDDGEVEWLDPAAITGGKDLASLRFLGWNRPGSSGLIAASSSDFEDAWLFTMDAATATLRLVHHLHDDAWVAGPCSFWNSCSGWLPDGSAVWFTSERDGFNHLYRTNADGSDMRQLTQGSWEIHGVEVSPARDAFLLTTNEGSPHQVHLWRANLDGSNRTRITDAPGRQDATVSPDGERLAIVHSFANQPPELYVAENRPGATMRRVTTSPTGEWQSFPWLAPEIVQVSARDGTALPARIYRPADLGAQANGAAVIFVHGAGYLQNVHEWWSSYYREYMFHHLLAARGFVVLDIDYRGSAGYGRDWRTAIFRHMGGHDLSDQVDGSRYLQSELGIDPERIGIYGGSYGGFITLMALFTAPESFGAGAALRSVTDWAHYNHGYTGRILNLPQEDSLAYERSSPIYFAEGLEDPLLIAHGMVDTNVHFSDVVRLVQRLIELGKTDWELAVYPVEDHGFVVPSSWTDEYRRILELFVEHLGARAGTNNGRGEG